MRRLLTILLLALAIALATPVGWWLVPLIGFLWGLIAPGRRLSAVTIAAGLGWGGWLVYDGVAGHGGLGRLGARLGPVLHAPFPLLLAVTLVIPMLLAVSAGYIGAGLGGAARGRGVTEGGSR